MSLPAIIDTEDFHLMEEVVELMRKHGGSETKVARELKIPRKDVISLHQQYRDLLINDSEARDMARDHLNLMVKHYDGLIAKFYDLIEDLESISFGHMVAGQISGALKAIADLEKSRLDALQKAGLLEGADLGDELAERERREQVLIEILRNDLCNVCRGVVAQKLTGLTNTVEAVVVYDE